ncbi:MAG: tetratricopeptide repeat protein [Chlorobiaceae bacterium]|nr:tetratricopeptide repeat protein [Chlorobiaceae bacterium]
MVNAAQIQTKFEQAFACHQQGDFPQARALYDSVLAIEPNHVEALHLSGVMAAQAKQHWKAVELIGKAIALQPGNAAFHCNLGFVLYELKAFGDAVASFDKAISIKPDYFEAYINRGNALQELRKFDEAVESFEKAISIKPGLAETHFNLGNALKKLEKFDAAVESFDKAIALKPDLVAAYFNRGNTLLELKKFDFALESFDKAIALKPDYYDAHFNRGNALKELKEFDAAMESFNTAIAIKPDYYDAYSNRGTVLQELRQFDAAMESFGKAISLKPDFAEAYSNRGAVLMDLKRFDAALDSFDKAIAIKPDYHEVYSNRGNALKELNRFDAALESFDKSIAIKPDFAEAYSNRGVLLQELKKFDSSLESFEKAIAIKPDYHEAYSNLGILLEDMKQLDPALESYDRAIAIKPDYPEAYWNKSLTLLLGGNFRLGWELYEWRWKKDDFTSFKRNFTQPLWLGKESPAGKTILLHSEQGLGDTIHFCRYAPLVASLGARIILEVEQSLCGLLNDLPGISEVVVKGSALPGFDCHCPLMSLPLAFKTDLDSIPEAGPYLKSDPGKLAYWKERLGNSSTLRVGLVWSGNITHKHDGNRSIPLSTMIDRLPEDVTYVCLQKEVREIDRVTLESNPDILHFGDELNDFTDTAALCDLMDLVISVDTSVAHLNGALGNPTWVLLPYSPDWRWMLDRNDSPWYPSMRLFRQPGPDDWESVFMELNSALTRVYGK